MAENALERCIDEVNEFFPSQPITTVHKLWLHTLIANKAFSTREAQDCLTRLTTKYQGKVRGRLPASVKQLIDDYNSVLSLIGFKIGEVRDESNGKVYYSFTNVLVDALSKESSVIPRASHGRTALRVIIAKMLDADGFVTLKDIQGLHSDQRRYLRSVDALLESFFPSRAEDGNATAASPATTADAEGAGATALQNDLSDSKLFQALSDKDWFTSVELLFHENLLVLDNSNGDDNGTFSPSQLNDRSQQNRRVFLGPKALLELEASLPVEPCVLCRKPCLCPHIPALAETPPRRIHIACFNKTFEPFASADSASSASFSASPTNRTTSGNSLTALSRSNSSATASIGGGERLIKRERLRDENETEYEEYDTQMDRKPQIRERMKESPHSTPTRRRLRR